MLDNIVSLYPQIGRETLVLSGKNLVNRVGVDTIKEVIYSVLCGENLRDKTESLTRKRLVISNASLLILFLKGYLDDKGFLEQLVHRSFEQIEKSRKKEDQWLLQWLLGLTGKQVQNVLRDSTLNLDNYRKEYSESMDDSLQVLTKEFGTLNGNLFLGETKVSVDWRFFSYLFSSIGSQTLTLRGSEKSIYGKLFERLVLGSALSILGFTQESRDKPQRTEKVFWLSERENKRESDATLIYDRGRGIRFDIGFIGRGNTEISLDKVSRFEKEIEFGTAIHYLATIIIVDRIGEKSRIYDMARKIEGTIIQMSMNYWPKRVAELLREKLGFEHEIINMDNLRVGNFMRKELDKIDIASFL